VVNLVVVVSQAEKKSAMAPKPEVSPEREADLAAAELADFRE